jgi:hypothetical protein
MNSSVASPATSVVFAQLETPPVSNPVDAEVDIEVLKSVPKTFEINSEQTANWLVKKVVTAREYAERTKKWAEQEVRRAEREEKTLLFLFGRQIETWAKGEIGKLNGRRKSICLPAGTLCFRHEGAKLVIDDEEAVVGWARHNCPMAIQTVEKLSRTAVKAHFEKSGEMPDVGAHIEPEQERFRIA